VQDNTLVAVIELSLSSWLVAGVVPGIERQPLKKLEPDHAGLNRIAVAYEAGRDGFWLARWLQGHGIETHVIHHGVAARRSACPPWIRPSKGEPSLTTCPKIGDHLTAEWLTIQIRIAGAISRATLGNPNQTVKVGQPDIGQG